MAAPLEGRPRGLSNKPSSGANAQVADFRDQGLVKVPDLEKCGGVRTLDLSLNRISDVEGLASAPPLLLQLLMRANQLQRLVGFPRLLHLHTLELTGNCLTGIDGMDGLRALRTLRLSHNRLQSINAVRELSCLTFLDASHNCLSGLEGVGGLTALEELHLDFNRLKKLEGLSTCPALQELSAAHNTISEVCGLSAHSRLDTLRLDRNALLTLDFLPLQRLPALSELSISGNPIVSLDLIPQTCPALEILDASDMRLDDLGATLHALKKMECLVELKLEGNPLVDEVGGVKAYRQVIRMALPSLALLDEAPAGEDASNGASPSPRTNPPVEDVVEDESRFYPSVEEMEEFKRRLNIHPSVDPFGRTPGSDLAGQNIGSCSRPSTSDQQGTCLGPEGHAVTQRVAATRKPEENEYAAEEGEEEGQGGKKSEAKVIRTRPVTPAAFEMMFDTFQKKMEDYRRTMDGILANLKRGLLLAPEDALQELKMQAGCNGGPPLAATATLPAFPALDLAGPVAHPPDGNPKPAAMRGPEPGDSNKESGRRGVRSGHAPVGMRAENGLDQEKDWPKKARGVDVDHVLPDPSTTVFEVEGAVEPGKVLERPSSVGVVGPRGGPRVWAGPGCTPGPDETLAWPERIRARSRGGGRLNGLCSPARPLAEDRVDERSVLKGREEGEAGSVAGFEGLRGRDCGRSSDVSNCHTEAGRPLREMGRRDCMDAELGSCSGRVQPKPRRHGAIPNKEEPGCQDDLEGVAQLRHKGAVWEREELNCGTTSTSGKAIEPSEGHKGGVKELLRPGQAALELFDRLFPDGKTTGDGEDATGERSLEGTSRGPGSGNDSSVAGVLVTEEAKGKGGKLLAAVKLPSRREHGTGQVSGDASEVLNKVQNRLSRSNPTGRRLTKTVTKVELRGQAYTANHHEENETLSKSRPVTHKHGKQRTQAPLSSKIGLLNHVALELLDDFANGLGKPAAEQRTAEGINRGEEQRTGDCTGSTWPAPLKGPLSEAEFSGCDTQIVVQPDSTQTAEPGSKHLEGEHMQGGSGRFANSAQPRLAAREPLSRIAKESTDLGGVDKSDETPAEKEEVGCSGKDKSGKKCSASGKWLNPTRPLGLPALPPVLPAAAPGAASRPGHNDGYQRLSHSAPSPNVCGGAASGLSSRNDRSVALARMDAGVAAEAPRATSVGGASAYQESVPRPVVAWGARRDVVNAGVGSKGGDEAQVREEKRVDGRGLDQSRSLEAGIKGGTPWQADAQCGPVKYLAFRAPRKGHGSNAEGVPAAEPGGKGVAHPAVVRRNAATLVTRARRLPSVLDGPNQGLPPGP